VRKVVEVDEEHQIVRIQVNNVLITFYGTWDGNKLRLDFTKSKPHGRGDDPGALDIPDKAFVAALRQAAQIFRERRERAKKPTQLTIEGLG